MNSENSNTPKPHILKLKLTEKLDLRLDKKVIELSNLSIYQTWNNIKSSYNSNKFKTSNQHGIKNFYYEMDLIRYQIFKIILNIF